MPLCAVCAKPDCPSKKATVDCQRCQLVRYCSRDCSEKDHDRHQSLCEAHQRRKGTTYMAHNDTISFVMDDENELYSHLGSDVVNKGPTRLFSKHQVKSLIAPEDSLVGDEINIQIKGKSVQSAIITLVAKALLPRDYTVLYTSGIT